MDEGEGVRRTAADEDKSPDDIDDTAELGVREAPVMEGLVREAGMVVCAVTGPVPRANSRDGLEQHVGSSLP